MPSNDNRIAVKNALADKYEHLSRIAGSEPKRRQFTRRAVKHRRQAEQLARECRPATK